MGIQPIDLQTMFAQLDKISNSQVQQTQAAQIQSALKQEEIARKQTAAKAAVEEPSKLNDGLGSIKDQNRHNNNQQEKKRDQEEAESREEKSYIYKDPNLGQHIDVSG